jgi:hypothetical protein
MTCTPIGALQLCLTYPATDPEADQMARALPYRKYRESIDRGVLGEESGIFWRGGTETSANFASQTQVCCQPGHKWPAI